MDEDKAAFFNGPGIEITYHIQLCCVQARGTGKRHGYLDNILFRGGNT
jgi:hypothetical protein